MWTRSRTVRLSVAFVCLYACAGRFSFDSLPLSARAPQLKMWYHSPAIVIPGVVLTLPAIAFVMLLGNLIPRGDAEVERTWYSLLASVDPFITIVWCVILYFLLLRVFQWFDERHVRSSSSHEVKESG